MLKLKLFRFSIVFEKENLYFHAKIYRENITVISCINGWYKTDHLFGSNKRSRIIDEKL